MPRRRQAAGACAAFAAVCALSAAGATAGRAPVVTVAPPLPQAVRGGATVVVSGRIRNAPAGVAVVLEQKAASGWRVLVRGRIEASRFTLRWRPHAPGLIKVRAALRLHSRDLAVSAAGQVVVGQAPVYCAAATPPASLPAGDGWIGGGVYIDGGPYPGIHACASGDHTVTVLDRAGNTVATQHVPDGESYAIVLPAGGYTLSSGFCRGSATVVAGVESQADILCFVP
jgi:hypothetical protein